MSVVHEISMRAMTPRDLDGVMALEAAAYPFPWSRGNFIDSLSQGYQAEVRLHARSGLVGYFLAMHGVDELHLLNLTVAPAHQGQGHARAMLDHLVQQCRERRVPVLWLEVRLSNARARALYRRYGFTDVGLRRGYYPAEQGLREDALVMKLVLAEGAGDAVD